MSFPFKVLFVSDRQDQVEAVALNLRSGYEVRNTVITSGIAFRSSIKNGFGDFDVAYVHKDFHSYNLTAEEIIHCLQEDNPTMRIVVASGEFPHGEQEVIKYRADSYVSYLIPTPMLLRIFAKGPVSPREMETRGKSVSMPEEEIPNNPERIF